MALTTIEAVTVVPGGGRRPVHNATVVLDDGYVVKIIPGEENVGAPELMLVPGGIDLHLDNLSERRRPRATVQLDHATVLTTLDAECAAAGLTTVCIAARCEDSPRKNLAIADAARLAATVERLAPTLSCDWRIHARVELTDERSVQALRDVLAATSRVALISMIESSLQRSRFSTLDELTSFYSQDWGVTRAEVEEVFTVGPARAAGIAERRTEVARIAHDAGIALATHDDRTPEHIDQAFAAGAQVAEFPLTPAAAQRAQDLGMAVVLGAPNALRGRSTSSGNILAADAVAADLCDVLCSDYLPAAVFGAVLALASRGVVDLGRAVDLVSSTPALVLGLPRPVIKVGAPLTASLRRVVHVPATEAESGAIPPGPTQIGLALWREGRLVFSRDPAFALEPPLASAGRTLS